MSRPNSKLPIECFQHWVNKNPDKNYLVQPMADGSVVSLTWKQVDEQARRFAAFLQAQDIPENSNIALMSANCAWWIIADLGIWMAGHVSVPLYPDLAPDTVSYILDHSESKLVVVGKLAKWDDMKPGVPAELPKVSLPICPEDSFEHSWNDIQSNFEPLADIAQRDENEMGTMVYTSGSTGQPKGVMHSFASLQSAPQAFNELLTDLTDDERVLSYLPLAHVFERCLIEQASLYFGYTVYFMDSLATFQQDLQRARPTQFLSVPRLWVKFQEGVNQKMPPSKQQILFKIPFVGKKVKGKILENLGLDQCRYAMTGSAPLAADIIGWYQEIGLELLEGYGMSENFCLSHFNRPGQSKIGTVGVPGPGVEHKIAENGEIMVRSPCNMMGYYKNPEKTREELTEDGWLHTGDMGKIDEAGRLQITGRVKELFKTSKGKYVAPAPIENKITNIAGVEAVCVAGDSREQPHALIQLDPIFAGNLADQAARDNYASELEAAIKEINGGLDHHEKIGFAVICKDAWTIDDGHLTPTMKIKRNVIESEYAGKLDAWYDARQAVIWE